MKPTGPTKQSTRRLIVGLEKHGKKSGENIWLAVAERLSRPTRRRPKVNLWKLSRIGKKTAGKTIVVPGKVLGTGELEGKMSIAAFEFSGSAMEKIKSAKGEAIKLGELLERKPKAESLVIVSG